MQTSTLPRTDQVWDWLGQIPDPEIPVVSLTDLGIIRDVVWDDDTLVVTVTPKPGVHVYAPDNPAYTAVAVNVENLRPTAGTVGAATPAP